MAIWVPSAQQFGLGDYTCAPSNDWRQTFDKTGEP